MALFEKTFKLSPATRILDVGGQAKIWHGASCRPNLTFLNLPGTITAESKSAVVGRGSWVVGDGCSLPFGDKSFDIVFSNSVIEHVGDLSRQRQFAKEVLRVGKSYWVQTPNRTFPIEQHSMLPLVHYLPQKLKSLIFSRFTLWEYVVRPTAQEREWFVNHLAMELRLLNRQGLQGLFPFAEIIHEPIFGLVKSIIAWS